MKLVISIERLIALLDDEGVGTVFPHVKKSTIKNQREAFPTMPDNQCVAGVSGVGTLQGIVAGTPTFSRTLEKGVSVLAEQSLDDIKTPTCFH